MITDRCPYPNPGKHADTMVVSHFFIRFGITDKLKIYQYLLQRQVWQETPSSGRVLFNEIARTFLHLTLFDSVSHVALSLRRHQGINSINFLYQTRPVLPPRLGWHFNFYDGWHVVIGFRLFTQSSGFVAVVSILCGVQNYAEFDIPSFL
jgi:hypothetical protein